MHYIMFANYGITGWASVAMPILPSAFETYAEQTTVVFFLFYGIFCFANPHSINPITIKV